MENHFSLQAAVLSGIFSSQNTYIPSRSINSMRIWQENSPITFRIIGPTQKEMREKNSFLYLMNMNDLRGRPGKVNEWERIQELHSLIGPCIYANFCWKFIYSINGILLHIPYYVQEL